MRLSLKKAAYVGVCESSVVGNPEFARDDKVEGGDFYWGPSGGMDRKKQQALRYASLRSHGKPGQAG